MSVPKEQVTQEYASLVQLATDLDYVLGTLKTATQQLSQSGVTRDISVLAQLPKTLPILNLLEQLEALQTELLAAQERDQTVVLGLRDRKVVAQAIDIVLLFEVLPRRPRGVGVELSKRLTSHASSVMTSLMRLPNGRRNWEPSPQATLSQITERLAAIVDRGSRAEGDVAAVLISKYHADIVASLLLLAYAPLPPAGVDVPAYVEADNEKRTQLRRVFTRIFDSSSPYLLLETLTSLLNAATRGRAPRWFVTVCGRFLVRVVSKYTDSVRICLDFLAARDDAPSAEKLDRIAGLLLAPPAQTDADSYWLRVVPQLRRLACADDTQERVRQAAVFSLRRLADTQMRVFEQQIALPVTGPLRRWFVTRKTDCTSDDGGLAETKGLSRPRIEVLDESSKQTVATASELGGTLDALRHMVLGGVPSVQLVSALVVPVFAPLFHWLAFASVDDAQPNDETQDTLHDVLVTTLSALPATAATATILELVQHTRGDEPGCEWPVFVRSGQMSELVWHAGTDEQQQHVVPVDTLVGVLGSERLRELSGDVFLALLREQEALLEMVATADANAARKWWLVSQVVMAVVERLGPRVLARHADILAFILNILDRHGSDTKDSSTTPESASEATLEELMQSLRTEAEEHGNSDIGGEGQASGDIGSESNHGVGGTEMVVLALMLLGQVMSASEAAAFAGMQPEATPDMPKVEWDGPSLQLLRRILDVIGRVGHDSTPMIAQLCMATKRQVSLVLALHAGAGPSSSSDDSSEADMELRRFNAALRDVRDTLVPVQAHGIIELRNMVLAKSRVVFESTERLDAVTSVFVEHVSDADSFVYLNAIRALAALADAHGRVFVPQLVSLYEACSETDERLRMGEALVQCVERAGAMLGEYAHHVVPALVRVVQQTHDEPVVLFSAVSILAAAARTSPVALHRWLDEIAPTLADVLLVAEAKTDDAWVAVRRACAVFWADLCTGYGDRLLELCDANMLRDVYKTLKNLEAADPDEIVRLQAQSGIALIDATVRGQLMSNYLP
ncbi:hypothetical protein GGH12_002651 [Coemansia sp. RSA 1822]|nr:hypothetical protein LPJ76_001860 [Coemansia sp. RSA 638]KAJ2563311.1 hypothetical protein GGH12_002651 [Coemansia sp. RSA 1822]